MVVSSITGVSQEQGDPTKRVPRTEVRNLNRSLWEAHTGRLSRWPPTRCLGWVAMEAVTLRVRNWIAPRVQASDV